MKCEHVQSMIWSGELSAEVEQHLQTCEHCQSEDQEMKSITAQLGTIQTPMPSRSLQPSREIIRQTVKRNRRKRWTNITMIAASLVLMIGVGTMVTESLMQGNTPAPVPVPVPQPEPQPQPDTPKPTDSVQHQLEVVVATSAYPQFTAAIKQHLLQKKPLGVRKITITDYNPSSSFILGQVQMEYETATGQAKRTELVRLIQQNGAWTVDLLEGDILPKTAGEAAKTWAEAMQKQDGLLEYSVLHPDLKKESLTLYQVRNWTTNLPEIAGYTVEKVDVPPLDPANEEYKVTFNLQNGKSQHTTLTIRSDGNYRWVASKLYIVPAEMQARMNQLTLPDNKVIRSDTDLWVWEDMNFQLGVYHMTKQDAGYAGIKALFGQYPPNTSVSANIPNVPDAVFYDFVGQPSNPIQLQQYFLLAQRDDPNDATMSYVYMIRADSRGARDEIKKKFLEIVKTWRIEAP